MVQHGTHEAKKSSKAPLVIIIILLLLVAVGVGALLLLQKEDAPIVETTPDTPSFAPNASIGALPGKTEEEIQAMLNQQVTDKTVAYTVNANPVFEDGKSEGNLMLESPANNINYIEFVIRRDDNNQVLYRSGLLQPNQYIETDKLLVELEKGLYPCTVDITLYDAETYEAKGMTQAGITINVKN